MIVFMMVKKIPVLHLIRQNIGEEFYKERSVSEWRQEEAVSYSRIRNFQPTFLPAWSDEDGMIVRGVPGKETTVLLSNKKPPVLGSYNLEQEAELTEDDSPYRYWGITSIRLITPSPAAIRKIRVGGTP